MEINIKVLDNGYVVSHPMAGYIGTPYVGNCGTYVATAEGLGAAIQNIVDIAKKIIEDDNARRSKEVAAYQDRIGGLAGRMI